MTERNEEKEEETYQFGFSKNSPAANTGADEIDKNSEIFKADIEVDKMKTRNNQPDMDGDTLTKDKLFQTIAMVISSYFSKNEVSIADIPVAIESVFGKMVNLSSFLASKRSIAGGTKGLGSGNLAPAVLIEESVTPDYIICLEDGKKLKMMKRYLRAKYQMTPEEYRLRWSLPSNYPMVAPNYAKKRSMLARQTGLGLLAGSANLVNRAQKKANVMAEA